MNTVAEMRVAVRQRFTPVVRSGAKHERRLYRYIIQRIRLAQRAIDMEQLEQSLMLSGTGAPLYVLDTIINNLLMTRPDDATWTHDTYIRAASGKDDEVADLLHAALVAGAASITVQGMTFMPLDPEVVLWVDDRARSLSTAVSRSASDAIRVTVLDGFENGVSLKKMAQLIRANLGLTGRDAAYVMKRQKIDRANGVSEQVAAARAERLANRLTRDRALTIARTEAMTASNEGQQQLWNQAQREDLLSSQATKEWVTFDPCPICLNVSGEVVGIRDEFSIGGNPPAHPRCRCTIGLSRA